MKLQKLRWQHTLLQWQMHFIPGISSAKKNRMMERQFATRLHTMAKTCFTGFNADTTDDFIQDQIIDLCTSKRLRTKLLGQKELTLKTTLVLDIAQAMEASERQAAEMAHERSDSNKAYAIKRAHSTSKPSQREQNSSHGKLRQTPHTAGPRQQGHKPSSATNTAANTNLSCMPKTCSHCGQKGHPVTNANARKRWHVSIAIGEVTSQSCAIPRIPHSPHPPHLLDLFRKQIRMRVTLVTSMLMTYVAAQIQRWPPTAS